jgi:stage II sporulation protein D
MKTKVLALNVDKSMSFTRFQTRLESSIKPFTDDSSFIEFEDIREMFLALQNALENEGLVITAVDAKNYLKFKNALIQAFGTEVVYNSTVLNKLETSELDDKKKKAFSAFPEPATVFVSEDGMYSGMVMESSNQYLVLLPIDNDRIDDILRNGLVPFLYESFSSYEIDDVEMELSFSDKVAIAVNSILESNSLVAVNGTRNAEVLKSCGNSVEGFNNAFIFTPYVEDKGKVNPTEYTAQLARASLDLSAANIGACISDIYSNGDLKYICIAVSKDDTALVRKLYMAEDETEKDFVESAALELIELVAEKASGKRSVGIEIADDNAITDEDKKIVNKKPLAILAIVVGVAIILCAIIGLVFQTENNGGLAGSFGSLFDKETTTEIESTTIPPQTETTTEHISVQAYNPSLMKLSDYIVSEIMSMEESEIAAKAAAVNSVAPEYITVNGERIDPKVALARLVTAELSSGYKIEAVKAHVVAAYSCLKFLGNGFNLEGVRISENYSSVVMSAVEDVYGEYLTFENALALPVYHGVTAGSPLDMSMKLPYLKSVTIDNAPDANSRDFISEKIYSVDEMKALLTKNNSSIVLSDNPAEWFVIKTHNSSVSSETGYVTEVSFNGVEMTGIEFRMNVLNPVDLPSLCFTISYDADQSRFIVKSYGQGYGIGMSQAAGKQMAMEGYSYKVILEKYYEGTSLTKEAIL